jgi:hypothetical protein
MASLTGLRANAAASLFARHAACGGKVEIGRDTASGAGGSTSSATSSTGGTTECPPNQPTETAPCARPPGSMCCYGHCCPYAYSCVDGHWQESEGTGPPPACPDALPEPQSSCGCMYGLSCTYEGGDTTAVCPNDTWQVTCGGEVCQEGELCVHTLGGSHCAPNECDGAPACDCTNACEGIACIEVSGYEVYCAAP